MILDVKPANPLGHLEPQLAYTQKGITTLSMFLGCIRQDCMTHFSGFGIGTNEWQHMVFMEILP